MTAALQAAHAAGELIVRRFHQPHSVESKGPADLVTEVDREAEDLIVHRLLSAFPGYQVLAEENHRPADTDAPIWVVDPLDGTRNYSRGIPFFCVSIALQVRGETVVGVIHDPLHDETFSAQRGCGAELNGSRIPFAHKTKLEEALVVVGTVSARNLTDRNLSFPIFMRARPLVESVRMSGSAALNLAYVACGRWDIVISDHVSPWDILAGTLLIQESGGVATELTGQPISLTSQDIVGANVAAFHERILELTQQVIRERASAHRHQSDDTHAAANPLPIRQTHEYP